MAMLNNQMVTLLTMAYFTIDLGPRWAQQEMFLEEAAKDSAKACAIFVGRKVAGKVAGKAPLYNGNLMGKHIWELGQSYMDTSILWSFGINGNIYYSIIWVNYNDLTVLPHYNHS